MGVMHLRAVACDKRVAARLRLKCDRCRAASPLRELDVHVGSHDVKAVGGVVAFQANFETLAGLHTNLRRREREPLGGDFDHARVLCARLRQGYGG